MRTYDYILAMREENQTMELESVDDSDSSSDESIDSDSPEKPTFVSRFICRKPRINQVTFNELAWFLCPNKIFTQVLR